MHGEHVTQRQEIIPSTPTGINHGQELIHAGHQQT